MSNETSLPEFIKQQEKKISVLSFSAQITGRCTCGGVLTLHTVSGVGSPAAQCPKCQTKYKIALIEFKDDQKTETRLRTGFAFEVPAVVIPHGSVRVS